MLGNSRLLIIVISVLSAVALICLGASAKGVFSDQYTYTLTVASFSAIEFSCPNVIHCDIYGADGVSVAYTVNDPNGRTLSMQRKTDTIPGYGSYTGYYLEYGDEYMYVGNGSTVARTYNITCSSRWTSKPQVFTEIVDSSLVDDSVTVFESVLSVGNKLVSFVISSWVVLVPVVAFVCILGFGVIRRIVRGV